MIRCLRTTRSARSRPGLGQDRLLVLAALDEPFGLEPLQHLAGRRARDAEHLGDARRERRQVGLAAGTRRSGRRGSRSSRGIRRPSALRHRRPSYRGGDARAPAWHRRRGVRSHRGSSAYAVAVGAFFHAVQVFGDHLAAVRWQFLAIALGLHLAAARPPRDRLADDPPRRLPGRADPLPQRVRRLRRRRRHQLGRAGPRRRRRQALPDQAPDPGRRATRRSRRRSSPRRSSTSSSAARCIIWALVDRRAADAPGLLAAARRSTGASSSSTAGGPRSGSRSCSARSSIGFILFVEKGGESRARIARGFAIFGDPPRLVRGVILPQALSWVLRIASLYYFLEAFDVHASIHNALLALVVDSLATLFPATPGGAGTKQGLIVFLFHGEAISQVAAARLQRRDEHRDRRLQPRARARSRSS